MKCKACGRTIAETEVAIQARLGTLYGDCFDPNEDYGYYHVNCFPDKTPIF